MEVLGGPRMLLRKLSQVTKVAKVTHYRHYKLTLLIQTIVP